MRYLEIFTLGLLVLVAGSLYAGKSQTKCPLTGERVDREVFFDHKGQRVYFCCPDCPDKFKAAPASYLAKFELDSVELEKAPVPQKLCPVMGGEIDKTVYSDHKGKRVYFCCANCQEKFKADPAKFIKKLENEGITLEKTPSTDTPTKSGSEGMKHDNPHHNH